MKLSVPLAIAVIGLFALSTEATILVDLPGLTGEFSIGGNEPPLAPSSRTTSFVFPDSIQSLEGLRLLVMGPWNLGQKEECISFDGNTYCDTIPCGTSLTLHLTSESLGGCYFQATVPANVWVENAEPLVGFCPEGQADIDLLLGSEVTAELYCDSPLEEVSQIIEATYGTLFEVQLETVGAVPAKQTSWGGVKALFR